MNYFKIFYYFQIISVNILLINADCIIKPTDELSAKTPVFLTADNQLRTPDGLNLNWRAGETSTILCSGLKNVIENTNINEATITCEENNKFSLNGKSIDPKNIACEKPIGSFLENLKEPCANGGVKHEIGFKTNPRNFIKYIDICYNLDQASVVYTHHFIPGKAIDANLKNKSRPGFRPIGIPKHVDAQVSYKKLTQFEQMRNLLGDNMVNNYLNSTTFLSRGHLTPDSDAVFHSWQLSTYFYVNVAPQWQNINSKNWVRIENAARKKASNLKDNLEVYTGISGILKLKNDNDQLIPISLDANGGIPVPKYFWKILIYKNEGIAFVTLNDPFTKMERDICKNVCKQYNWNNDEFDLYEKGKTICCTTKELFKVFQKEVPVEAVKMKILKF